MTLILVVINCLLSFAAFRNETLLRKLIFNPYSVKRNNEWYQFITSGFIHADAMHLLFNMFALYSFGSVVEVYFKYFFAEKAMLFFGLLYFGGLIISVVPTYFKEKDNPSYNSLGASGAVSAVIFSSILFQPLQKIYLFGMIGFPGILLGIAYLVYSYYASRKGIGNINHDAHFWGAAFGIAFTLLLNPRIFSYFLVQITGSDSE